MSMTAPSDHDAVEVDVDSRRRVSLGKVGKAEHTRYRMTANELGEILLVPLVSLPVREVEIWRNADLRASLARGIRDVEDGKVVDLGSFAEYVKDGDTKAE